MTNDSYENVFPSILYYLNSEIFSLLFYCCRFTKIPEVLYKVPKLEILFVNDNKFDNIDAAGLKQLQSNLDYPNVDYPKLLRYSKTTDSRDFFLYYLLQ